MRRRDLLIGLGAASLTPPALAQGTVPEPYGGQWWGCMEVFDNAANINTKNRAAMAWTCRYSGRLTGWRAWIKRRPLHVEARDYSRGDGGSYRFYLHEAEPSRHGWRPAERTLGRTQLNGGYGEPLAVKVVGKRPIEDGWINEAIPQYITFLFEEPVAVEQGRRYWVEFRNETPGSGYSAWDNCIVEQKFPKALTSGLYFADDEFYIDDSGDGSWIQKTFSRGPNEAIYEDGIVEGSYVSSAGWRGRIDITDRTWIRQLFRLPRRIVVQALTARIYYKGDEPGPLLVTLDEGANQVFEMRLPPHPYGKLPPILPAARPHYATEERGFDIPGQWPAVPWVAPLGNSFVLEPGKDYALTIQAQSGSYRVGQMSVWGGDNIHKCWTHDRPGCQFQVSNDGGTTWQGTKNQVTLALQRVP
jgi:hypothetical protein